MAPSELADKLDVYCSIPNTAPSKKTAQSREYIFKPYSPERSSPNRKFHKTKQAGSTSSYSRDDKLKTDDRCERTSVSCYGCCKSRITKPRRQNCKTPGRIRTQQILATFN
ncbi:hypothetical protein NPIL_421821 [Nephila pilipes]|uniref:Uncharacterized protein n=1 Tax=Nephila pilipes TaxID=299642 RepID=A0A8X6P4U5_NEPPI|nr:hypothetical protein NPIL_421821 [Nephila pilipes]